MPGLWTLLSFNKFLIRLGLASELLQTGTIAAVVFSCTMPCRIFAAVNFSRTAGPTQVSEKRAKWPEIRKCVPRYGGAVSGNTRMGTVPCIPEGPSPDAPPILVDLFQISPDEFSVFPSFPATGKTAVLLIIERPFSAGPPHAGGRNFEWILASSSKFGADPMSMSLRVPVLDN